MITISKLTRVGTSEQSRFLFCAACRVKRATRSWGIFLAHQHSRKRSPGERVVDDRWPRLQVHVTESDGAVDVARTFQGHTFHRLCYRDRAVLDSNR